MIKRLWKGLRYDFLHYALVYLSKAFLRILLFTCKVEVQGLEIFRQVVAKNRSILMLWHNRLTITPEILRRYAPENIYCAVISQSRDGQLLAILANSYSAGRTLRVPHNARHQALSKIIKHLKNSNEIVVITPDGPRGPCYKVKPGIVVAAKEASASIVPFTWSATRCWQLKTWDKLIIPKPFSRIRVAFGNSLEFQKESKNTLVEETETLEKSLLSLEEIMSD